MTTEINNTSLLETSTDNATIIVLYEISEQMADFIKILTIIYPVIFGLIAVTGIVGNTLTITAILRHKDINSTTDILIINLAVADILFIIFTFPNFILIDLHFGDEWNQVRLYVNKTSSFISIYTIVLMSLDKYIALVHPFRSLSLRTKRNCYKAIIVIWSIILLVNIPMIIIPLCCSSVNYWNMYVVCCFIFEFVLPIILLCFLYGHMLKIYTTGNIPGFTNHISRVMLQSKQRVIKMVITVVLVFIIFRLPFFIVKLYRVFVAVIDLNIENVSILLVIMCMYYLNCCINPILYTFYSQKFRSIFRDLLRCASRNDIEHGTALNRQ